MKTTTHLVRALLLISCLATVASARVDTVRFQSKLINATLPYNVILPTDYDTSKTTRYPVLYLLHGLTSHYSDWISRSNVAERFADSLKLFGALASETRAANDLYDIIVKLTPARIASLPYFYFDCGTEDSPVIFPFNRELAALMFEKKIPHEFRELPGDHSWAYWDRQVREILRIAADKMRMPPTKRISRA